MRCHDVTFLVFCSPQLISHIYRISAMTARLFSERAFVTFLSHDRVRKPQGMRVSTCRDDETASFHEPERTRIREK